MAIERRMMLYVGPKQRLSEIDDDYQRRRAVFRVSLAAAWWGSLLSTVCSSMALGIAINIPFALIPWAVWFGLISIVGMVVMLLEVL